MKKTIGLLGAAGLFVSVAFAQSHRASKAQDEQALRKIESETASFEQQNDPSTMGALAHDWICLMNFDRKTLSKAAFQKKLAFAAYQDCSPSSAARIRLTIHRGFYRRSLNSAWRKQLTTWSLTMPVACISA